VREDRGMFVDDLKFYKYDDPLMHHFDAADNNNGGDDD
jgi:hypothetical protein